MDRTSDPVMLAIRHVVEAELSRLGFQIASEQFDYDAFRSASFEYWRPGARVRLTWDGKDRWAWVNVAPQLTKAFPPQDSYVDVDARFVAPNAMASYLTTVAQG